MSGIINSATPRKINIKPREQTRDLLTGFTSHENKKTAYKTARKAD
ncbi:hypothetical protein ACTWOG_004809 [Serratia marcescens]